MCWTIGRRVCYLGSNEVKSNARRARQRDTVMALISGSAGVFCGARNTIDWSRSVISFTVEGFGELRSQIYFEAKE